MIKVNKTILQSLLDEKKPLLVLFGPSWHPMTTKYQSIIDGYNFNGTILKTVYVDLDEWPELISQYAVRIAPAVILFIDGQVKATAFILNVIQNISGMIGEDLYARARSNNS